MASDQARASPARLDRIADRLQIGRNPAAVRQRIEAMEMILERSITIPGIRRRITMMPISSCTQLKPSSNAARATMP